MILFQLFATGVVDTGCKFTVFVVETGGKLPPLSLTPVAKLPPVSTTSAVLVAKFAPGIRAGSVQLSEESHRVEIPRFQP
jgi:hypothetical protein